MPETYGENFIALAARLGSKMLVTVIQTKHDL